MATAMRSEPVGAFFKTALVDGFKNHLHDFLNELVLKGRNTERALLAVLLGYVNSLGRVRLITFIPQLGNDGLYAFDAHATDGLTVCAFRHVARFMGHHLIGIRIQILVEQQSVKPFKLVVRVLAVPSQTV